MNRLLMFVTLQPLLLIGLAGPIREALGIRFVAPCRVKISFSPAFRSLDRTRSHSS